MRTDNNVAMGDNEDSESNYRHMSRGANHKGHFSIEHSKPDWFDEELFRSGRTFYAEYKFGCVMSMLVSLIMGLSLPNLLQVLVLTQKSETGPKSFKRYVRTLLHIDSWFSTDIFDINSKGYRSIKIVRRIHESVAKKAETELGLVEDRTYVSQTDLAKTLIGFAGMILVAPKRFGIASEAKLAGYIHCWRVIGYLHGISDEFNPFGGGMKTAQNTVSDVLVHSLIPSLETPPNDFEKMVKAVSSWAGGRNGFIRYGLFIATEETETLRGVDVERVQMLYKIYHMAKIKDRLRYNYLYYLFHYCYPTTLLRSLLNWFLEVALFLMRKRG